MSNPECAGCGITANDLPLPFEEACEWFDTEDGITMCAACER